MVAPTPFFADRGCHVRILEEIKSLQQRGHQVVLCTYHHGRSVEMVDTRRIINIPWYSNLAAGPSWHKIYLDFLLLLKSLFVTARFKPDIIHAHLHEGAFIGKVLSIVFGKPLVFDYQGSLTAESVDHDFFRENGFLYKLACDVEGKVDYWPDIIVSSAPQNIHTKRLEVIYDGVDVEKFRSYPRDKGLCDKLGVPQDARIVSYLGVLGTYQGTDILLRVAKQIVGKLPNVYFLVMGYPFVEKYRAQAKAMGLAEKVILPGKIDYEEAANYISLGNVAVAPKISHTEANQKILNYMACGLPTVAFDTKGNRALLGDAGILVPLENKEKFTESLVALLRDDELQARLGKKARQRVERKFSWERVGARLEDVYKSL